MSFHLKPRGAPDAREFVIYDMDRSLKEELTYFIGQKALRIKRHITKEESQTLLDFIHESNFDKISACPYNNYFDEPEKFETYLTN